MARNRGILSVGSPAAAGGPYALHRGREAWAHAREFAKASGDAELTVVALLGLANIQFKLQRYRAAVLAAHAALTAIDGLNSPALRDALSQRPVHVIAAPSPTSTSTDHLPDDPFIPRNDTLDLETDPLIAEQKMHVGVARLHDPALVPPNQRWTAAVYLALMDEYESLAQERNLVDAAHAFVAAWPNHPEAPVVAHRIAEAWAMLSRYAPDSSRAKVQFQDAPGSRPGRARSRATGPTRAGRKPTPGMLWLAPPPSSNKREPS